MAAQTGQVGEEAVARWLRENGYVILDRNYHSRYGEIDIIARDETYLVFVEVKTRDAARKAEPQEAVTASKQRKLIQTALLYLQTKPEFQNFQPRFDVAGVTVAGTDVKTVRYFAGAFGLDCEGGEFF